MKHPRSFIESFVEYTSGLPTPDLFKTWAAVSCLSGAFERRITAITRNKQLVPNFMILLVAPPAVGKTVIIEEVCDLWAQVKPELNVAPMSVTRAGLIDQLNDKHPQRFHRDAQGNAIGTPFFYHSINASIPEFGVLVPKHDLEFLNTLNDLYDCRRDYVERKRSLKEVINIPRPHLNLLAGTQPAYLGELLPDTAYGMGFTSRCVLVYAGTGPSVPIFGSATGLDEEKRRKLIAHLNHASAMIATMTWSSEVQVAIQSWVNSGMKPVPEHYKLLHYSSRRDLMVLKLSMIFALAELRTEVELRDFISAKDLLLHTECFMPDVFKDMMSSPDAQVIADLVHYVRDQFAKSKSPISESRLVFFLSARVPSNRVVDILRTTISADLLDEYNNNGMKAYAPKKQE